MSLHIWNMPLVCSANIGLCMQGFSTLLHTLLTSLSLTNPSAYIELFLLSFAYHPLTLPKAVSHPMPSHVLIFVSMLPIAVQVAAKRAEAVKWQVMQDANSQLQSQQQRMQAEIQEWKARYRDEAAYSNELQAAANRLQTELTAAQLESQVCLLWQSWRLCCDAAP